MEEQELQEVVEFNNTLSWLNYIMVGQEKALARLRWPRRLELSSQDIEVLGRSGVIIIIPVPVPMTHTGLSYLCHSLGIW